MSNQETEGSIALSLNKNEAAVVFAALKEYERAALNAGPGRRTLIMLMTGDDPFEVAQTVRKNIDVAGSALWGGEVETYGEPDVEPDPA